MSTQLLQECFVQVTNPVPLLENLTSRKYLTGINSWEHPSRSKTISHSRSKSSFHFFHLFFCLFVCFLLLLISKMYFLRFWCLLQQGVQEHHGFKSGALKIFRSIFFQQNQCILPAQIRHFLKFILYVII